MDADVVVVGAGPVGLMLAAEPRLAGVEVVVLERLDEPTGYREVRWISRTFPVPRPQFGRDHHVYNPHAAGVAASKLIGPSTFGVHLRRLRLAAGLTQEMLAERSGISVDAISTLESGRRQRPHPTTVSLLADGLDLGGGEREHLTMLARRAGRERSSGPPLQCLPADAVPAHAPLPAGSRMPLAPNPLFVGRGEELLQIADALRGADTTVTLGQVVASTGLGGLGKTQLAVEFVHRYGCYFAGGVFWLSFASADEIPLQVAACAAPEFESRSLEERMRLVTAAWQSTVPRLLVFDSCEEEALLQTWRPTSGGCRVLVTSRRSHWSPTLGVISMPLDLLPRPDSVDLLRRYRPDLAADHPGLDAIADELGDLPLALHLAGSYLRAYRTEVSLEAYLAELGRLDVLRHASLLGAGLDDSPSPTHHVHSVAQTFALCLTRLDRQSEVDRAAIALLARMACLAPGEAVPRDLLARTLTDVSPLQQANGLRRLGAVGLVTEGHGWLRLHRLLAHFLRQQCLDPRAQPAVERALIECGEAAYDRQLNGAALAAVIPHLIYIASQAASGGPRVAELSSAAGLALNQAGDLRAARPWLERAVELRVSMRGPDHPDTASSLNDLGDLLKSLGEYGAARPLFERALAIRERLSPDHPDTAAALNNLAALLRDQGDLSAAKLLFERAVVLYERTLGPGHAHTGLSLHNLAHLLRRQGEMDAARHLFERALAIHTRVLTPDHPYMAWSLAGLASVLRDRGELDAARSLFERALRIRERSLGPNHSLTAYSLAHMADLLRRQGDVATASALFERALTIHYRVLGPDHPDTVATRRALEELTGEADGTGTHG